MGDLFALDTLADYKPLVDRTTARAAEVVLTAWRKLAIVPVNETLPVLDDEDKAETNLAALLTASSKAGTLEANRAAAIATEIKSDRPNRWHHWAETLVSPAPIETALTRRASFNVTLNPQTDARMIFNDSYFTLRKKSETAAKEADVRPTAQSFINTVNDPKMPADIRSDKNVQDLLTRLNKSLQQSNEESSSAGAGPKLAGWEQDTNPNTAVRIFYFPSKAAAKYTLAFDRLQVDQKTIYLCTTETPLGLFADTVNTPQRFSDLDNTGKSTDKQHWFKTSASDTWDGPRVWSVVGGKFVPNSVWLFHNSQMGLIDTAYYPNGTPPPAPSADMPMNQISPWSAMYVSRLLGCRLPTSNEWKAAYDKFEATAQTKDAWNLRGVAWQAQQDFAKQKSSAGMVFPDAGMFNTPDLMYIGITADGAIPWKNADLAKVAPARISSTGPEVYKGSALWFRTVGNQPGQSPAASGAMHDLVGNVAEYTFDAPKANDVIKDTNTTPDAVDAIIAGNKQLLAVIGGSSCRHRKSPSMKSNFSIPTLRRLPTASPTWGSASRTPRRSIPFTTSSWP